MIRAEKVTIKYGNKTIINDFSLSVLKKEKLLIAGPSGSGKSSVLKAFCGFTNIESGRIYIAGKELNEKNIGYIRNRIGYISQNSDIFSGTVKELISFIGNLKMNAGYFDFDKCYRLFSELKLYDIGDKEYTKLSGGEKQRVMIAVSLALPREIYLLDEITAALDTEMKETVIEMFVKSDKTVIAVSHDDSWKKYGFRIIDIGGGNGKY